MGEMCAFPGSTMVVRADGAAGFTFVGLLLTLVLVAAGSVLVLRGMVRPTTAPLPSPETREGLLDLPERTRGTVERFQREAAERSAEQERLLRP
jgi:hypothetical protein